jgi:hypothetical protein
MVVWEACAGGRMKAPFDRLRVKEEDVMVRLSNHCFFTAFLVMTKSSTFPEVIKYEQDQARNSWI